MSITIVTTHAVNAWAAARNIPIAEIERRAIEDLMQSVADNKTRVNNVLFHVFAIDGSRSLFDKGNQTFILRHRDEDAFICDLEASDDDGDAPLVVDKGPFKGYKVKIPKGFEE